jgi:hypothetical protein
VKQNDRSRPHALHDIVHDPIGAEIVAVGLEIPEDYRTIVSGEIER